MIITYLDQNNVLKKSKEIALEDSTVWIDLFNISAAEEEFIENFLGIDIPTLEEMRQIEISRRLYTENGGLYMTTVQLTVVESVDPTTHYVTFILHKHRLITVRYTELKPFSTLAVKLINQSKNYTASEILLELLRNTVERLGDILEFIRIEIDSNSRTIFIKNKSSKKKIDYSEVLEKIGYAGDLLSKSRESLVSLNRVTYYILQSVEFCDNESEILSFKTILTDINSISDFAQFLSGELNFILDATLGMIGIEQNNISKIFSIVAVLFLPPTLIASIYGMNFEFMPELKYRYGYPVALSLMVILILATYLFFKNKKWM